MTIEFLTFADEALKEAREHYDKAERHYVNFLEAKVHERAIVSMSATSQRLATAVVWLLWHVEENGFFEELGEYNFLRDWAHDALAPYYQTRYINRLVSIVTGLFNIVAQADRDGKPFINPDTGEVLTVAGLLQEGPSITRMSAISNAFGYVDDDEHETAFEKRTKLLEASYTGMAESEKAGREAMSGKDESPIPYFVRQIADGSFTVSLRGLNDRSLRRIEGRLKGIGEQHFE